MKRVSSRQLPGLLAEVQITPLVDLVLVLLLMVLVLVPVLRGVSHEDDRNTPTHAPSSTIELSVAPDLKLSLGGKSLDDSELIAELKNCVAADPNLGLLVRVPPDLKTPALLQIMDALRSANIRHTAVTTDTAAKP
jgi:biopolymer transport protein ExbD